MKNILFPIFLLMSFSALIINTDFEQPKNKKSGFKNSNDNLSLENEKIIEKNNYSGPSDYITEKVFLPENQETLSIGFKKDVFGNTSDNSIKINIADNIEEYDQIFLEYELYGLVDNISVCKRINENLAYGGLVIKTNKNWSKQVERLSPEVLRKGENHIQFYSYPDELDGYNVKNIQIRCQKKNVTGTRTNLGIVVTKIGKINLEKEYIYVAGFINGVQGRKAEVRIYGNIVDCYNSTFETLIPIESAEGCSNSISISALIDDKTEITKNISIEDLIFADRVNVLDKNISHIEQVMLNNKQFLLSFGAMTINADSGLIDNPKMISITGLRRIDMPDLPPDMVNVTGEHYGYRCLPHGTNFKNNLTLTLKYDPSKIPTGYGPDDINTYYYNDTLQQWIRLTIDTIDIGKQEIVSLTNHFTDFINAIIKEPEMPQNQAFTPTSIKDLDFANPLNGINIISPPTANNMGSLNYSFPIQIPQGRHGMQPQLSINYNSDAGNSSCGVGWNIAIPSIDIETKWGAPRFYEDKESESYLVNGEQIVELEITQNDTTRLPLVHMAEYRDRGTETETYYSYRIEGAFHRIIRHGTATDEYWWEVIDKNGTRYFYGKYSDENQINENLVLRQPETGSIAHWALAEVRDLYGNFVKYEYIIEDVLEPVSGQQIYINNIQYTGFNNTPGLYSIDFERIGRDDIIMSGNNGFMQITNKLIRSITIEYDGLFVRKYLLNYKEGAYKKTVLTSIADITDLSKQQYVTDVDDCSSLIQYNGATVHCMDYYEDEEFELSETPIVVSEAEDESQGFLAGLITDAPQLTIGKSSGASVSIGGSANVMFGAVPLKTLAAGSNTNFSYGVNNDKSQLIDLNGDGLTDRIIKDGDALMFYKGVLNSNNELIFETPPVDISIENEILLGKSTSFSVGIGAEITASLAAASYSFTTTHQVNSKYFADVNGDGFPDFVSKEKVYFNKPDENGIPSFSLCGSNPVQYLDENECYSIIYDGNIAGDIYTQESEEINRRDPVRMWMAPFNGKVKFEGYIQRINADENVSGTIYYSIVSFAGSTSGPYVYNGSIAPDNTSPIAILTDSIGLSRGDAVYFRLHSDNNCGFDDVIWDMDLKFPTNRIDFDENEETTDADEKRIFTFNYQEDAVIHDNQFFVAPFNGTVTIEATLESPAQSDVLEYSILLNETTLQSNTFIDATSFSNNFSDEIEVFQGDTIQFLLECESNVNWSDIDFNAIIEYDTIEYNNSLIEKNLTFYPSLQMSIYNNILCYSKQNILAAGSYEIKPYLNYANFNDGEIIFTAKSKRNLIAKKTLSIVNGVLQGGTSNYLQFTLNTTDTVFFDYFCANPNIIIEQNINQAVWNAHSHILQPQNNYIEVRSGFFYILPDSLQKFGNLYRGWGQFSYLDESFGGCDLIDEELLYSELSLIESTDVENFPFSSIDGNSTFENVVSMFENIGISDQTAPAFSIMMADRENNRWVDFCKGASIDSESMVCGLSSSIIIENVDNPEIFGADEEFDAAAFNASPSFGISKAPKKRSKQQTQSFSVKANMIIENYSYTWTRTKSMGLVDFMDMNGDKYPDIVGKTKIQYTDGQGGLSDDVFEVNNKFTSEGTSISEGDAFGIKGTLFSSTKSGDANKSKLKNISGSFGVSENEGNSIVNAIYFDVNGDGLPDRVSAEHDSVQYNVGYSFFDAIVYNVQGNLSKTKINSESIGLDYSNGTTNIIDAVNVLEYSFSFGLGENFNNSGDYSNITDVNNDGLADIIYLALSGSYDVSLKALINTGNGFYDVLLVQDFNKILTHSYSKNYDTNSAFSITIPIYGYFNLLLSFYNDISLSFSKDLARLTDVNGDGFLDFVFVDEDVTKAFFGIPKKTNLLKTVTTPGLAIYNTDFQLVYPSINNPSSKWTMNELMVIDGFEGDGQDTLFYQYEYISGKYNRYERESYGFDTIVTNQYDNFSNYNLYRSTAEVFHTDDFLFKGLKSMEIFLGTSGEKLVKSFIWDKKDISTGEILEGPANCFGPYYPAISFEIIEYFESYQAPQLTTKVEYQHGAYGNVKKYINHNNITNTSDDVIADITYDYNLSTHLLGLADIVVVKDYSNNLLRKTGANYNSQGSVTNISRVLDSNNIAETDFTYDQYGNITFVEYPENYVNERFSLQYDYDNETNTYPIRITDYWGNASYLHYDLRFGLPDTITDICGNQMYYTFYNDGRIQTVTGPKEIEANIPYTVKYEYWDEISMSVPHRYALTRHYDPTLTNNEFLTLNISDGLGKIVQSKKKAIINGQNMVVISGKSYYDFYGRLDSVSQPGTESYNANTFTSFSMFTPENFTLYKYDVFDRNTDMIFPDLTSVSFVYDFDSDGYGQNCFTKRTIDQNNNSSTVYTDARGLQTTLEDALSQRTLFLFSPLGELNESTDPDGNLTSYQYDALGRLINRDHPDAGVTTYKYDLAGNLIWVQTANLNSLSYNIDYTYHHCRLTEIHYPQNPEMDVYYEYGGSLTGNQSGKLVRQQDASGVQEFYYGNMGELIKNIHTFVVPRGEAYTFQTEWEYDTWNRIIKIIYPDGEELHYKYNDEGNLVFLAGEKGNVSYEYIESIKYDKYGKRTQIEYGNETSAEYSYDDKNLRLKTLVSYENGGNEMQHLDYTYDLAGNITAVENSGDFLYGNVGGEYNYNYKYDEIYRLTHAESSFTPYNQQPIGYKIDMTYSHSGNIVEKDVNGSALINGGLVTVNYQNDYYYTGRPHTVTQAGDYLYSWDLNGNMTRRRNRDSDRYLCWDEENRLTAVRDVAHLSQSSIYIYDAGGERVWKLTGEEMLTQVNGQTVSSNIYFEKTLYTGPYLVMTESDYTKHYYIEGERVCSKIGGGFGPANVQPANLVLDFLHGDAEDVAHELEDYCRRQIACVNYSGEYDWGSKLTPAGNVEDSLENLQYFYHPDHLGSAAVISFTSGRAYQHLQYFPFGELFVSQRNSSFDSRYKFSAKELDNETGYSYFGTRYYDSDLSSWLSVDPMAGERSWVSPYSYCQNNPVGRVDPTGALDGEILDWYKTKSGEIKYDASIHEAGDLIKKGISGNYLGKTYKEGGKYYSLFGQEKISGTMEGKLYEKIDDAVIEYFTFVNSINHGSNPEPTTQGYTDFSNISEYRDDFWAQGYNYHEFEYENAKGVFQIFENPKKMIGSLYLGSGNLINNSHKYNRVALPDGYNIYIEQKDNPSIKILKLVFPTLESRNEFIYKSKNEFK